MSRAVLIVEDTDTCISTLAIALQGFLGLQVQAARNGEDAWRKLEADGGRTICAVLTDLYMPVMDGFGLIEKIRATDALAHVPVLVLSGTTDPKAFDRALNLGAAAYFEKPYSPGKVRSKLEQLLYEKSGT